MGSVVATTTEEELSKPQTLDSDDLSKVTDIVLRRRIQNRLAQRLRRQKLREGKASQAGSVEPSKDGPLTSTPNSLPTTENRELISEKGQTPKTPASDGVVNLPDASMSEGEIAAILSRLDQTLAQLKSRVSAKPSECQISTSKLSLDPTYPSQAYWDPYMKSEFDANHASAWPNSLALLTSVLNSDANDSAGRRDSFTPSCGDNAVSTDLREMTASPWLATSKTQTLPKLPGSSKQAYVRSACNNSNSQTSAISCARGSTALHLAAQQGHFETVSLLLQNGGVDINACNSDGLSALHIAVTNNHTNMAHLLLTHGASSSLRTNAGLSVLHLAVLHGTLPLVLLVLRYVTVPGDLDLRDQDGRSAFHLAVARGDEEIVRSLLEKGANSMAMVGDQTPIEQSAMSF